MTAGEAQRPCLLTHKFILEFGFGEIHLQFALFVIFTFTGKGGGETSLCSPRERTKSRFSFSSASRNDSVFALNTTRRLLMGDGSSLSHMDFTSWNERDVPTARCLRRSQEAQGILAGREQAVNCW